MKTQRELNEFKAALSSLYRAEGALYKGDIEEAQLSAKNALSSVNELVAIQEEREAKQAVSRMVERLNAGTLFEGAVG